MKVLIVGTNSFLAQQLTKQLQLDHKDLLLDGIYNKNLDRTDRSKFRKLIQVDDLETLNDTYDLVFLIAAFIPYGEYSTANIKLITSNITLPARVLTQFESAKLVYASSVAVYGDITDKVITEDTPFIKPTKYGASKLAGETVISNAKRFAILRFTSIYGKGMTARTFLPYIVDKAKTAGQITLFGDGSRKQDYIHVEDAANLLIAASKHKDNSVLLGCNGTSVSNKEVAETIQSLLPNVSIDYKGEDQSASFDYSSARIVDLLNFKPSVTLRNGLEMMINE